LLWLTQHQQHCCSSAVRTCTAVLLDAQATEAAPNTICREEQASTLLQLRSCIYCQHCRAMYCKWALAAQWPNIAA
jgi:hypothetical protein